MRGTRRRGSVLIGWGLIGAERRSRARRGGGRAPGRPGPTLEDRLRAAGARCTEGTAWASFVVVDGDLGTGQNPASSAEAARRVVDRLREEAALPA
ncbi:hypothetical protein [Geodermatophilus sp. SYSU D01176]